MSYSSDKRRLAKNTISLYLRSIIVMVVGLYTSRVILQVLGAEDYGLYNVVGSVVVLFSFLNSAMTTAVQRYITYEIGKKDDTRASKVFSASMVVQMALSLSLLVIVEVVGIWFINNQLNIPDERMYAANWVFQFSVLTFCVSFVRVPYEATVIAHEKMTFFAYVSILDAVLKLVIVYLLQLSGYDKLITYAILIGIESVIVWQIYRIYCRYKFNTCKFRIVREIGLYKQLVSFSGWSLWGSATNVATQKGFIFLVNIFYGLTVNAALGITNQVNTAVFNFVNSFASSYRPQIVKTYAKGDFDHLFNLISSTSRYSFSLMVIPILILIFNMPLILEIWLKDVPQYTAEFCQIILLCTLIDAVTIPYNAAIMATARIKHYQLWISGSYVLDLVICFCLIKLGVLPYIVFFSRLVTRGFINALIGLFFIRQLIGFPIKNYIRGCVVPICLTLIVLTPCLRVLDKSYSGYKMLLYSSLFTVIVGLAAISYLMLTKSERKQAFLLMKKKLRK